MKIKAAILEEISKPLRIRYIDSLPLEEGQVLVKLFYSGICRSQLMEIQGKRGKDNWIPHLLGHEGSGEVIEIGCGVKKVKVGDKVILGWIKGNGINANGAKYLFNNKVINSGPVTTFSNYTIVSENRVYTKPDNIDFDQAVLYGCALPTGAGIILNNVKPTINSSVLIIGLGGIGLSSLIALKKYNCKNIITIDKNNEKLLLSMNFGASHCLNPDNCNVMEEVSKITNEQGVDYCIESAGTTQTIELGFSLINKNTGKLYFASHPSYGSKITLDPFELIQGKQIYGSWGGDSKPDRDIDIISDIVNSSNIQLNNLLTEPYELDDINIAIEKLNNNTSFRPLIKFI